MLFSIRSLLFSVQKLGSNKFGIFKKFETSLYFEKQILRYFFMIISISNF